MSFFPVAHHTATRQLGWQLAVGPPSLRRTSPGRISHNSETSSLTRSAPNRNSVKGELKKFDYEPKKWDETDVDIKVSAR